jgi:hypothetical protein
MNENSAFLASAFIKQVHVEIHIIKCAGYRNKKFSDYRNL